MREQPECHPKLDVEAILLGRSVEGREIMLLEIGDRKGEGRKAKEKGTKKEEIANSKRENSKRKMMTNTIFVMSGQHAREWLAPAVTIQLINKIIAEVRLSLRNSVMGCYFVGLFA